MALDCRSKCGASEYVEDVANPNWLEVEARLAALEAMAGMPAVYNNTTRPPANTVPVGRMIFNTDDGQWGGAPNWSTGSVWVDASGNET
jgi:hypothetical protein